MVAKTGASMNIMRRFTNISTTYGKNCAKQIDTESLTTEEDE